MDGFNRLLSRLIKTIAERGFDSVALKGMMMELRQAADRAFISEAELNARMAKGLGRYYAQALRGSRHASVMQYTPERLAPKLLQELNRRIAANADLIKINREQAIEKTLQRFAGWATSVPPGGDPSLKLAVVKSHVAKPAAQLKYEVRRREIDQGHKLIQAVKSTIATENGAIAYRWHSHWRQPGYDYRPDHKERDGKVYGIKDSWAAKQGMINKGAGWTDDMTQPAQEVYCQCDAVYLYALRDLPESMLTAKGKAELERVRIKNAS